jgi:hypothetical protein
LAFQYRSLSPKFTQHPFAPDSLMRLSNFVTSIWAFLRASEEARSVSGEVVE